MHVRDLDPFTRAYLECALWAETDDDGSPFDRDYALTDFAPEALALAVRDCESFQAAFGELIGSDYAEAGHDFWLTRNRHGAGFWDGGWPQEAGHALTSAAHGYPGVSVLVGDDGKLHFMGE